MGMKLYACCSIYNLLITLVKVLPTNEKVDLLVGTQTPDYETLLPRIEKLDNINHIYIYDSVSYKKISYKGKIDKLLRSKQKEIVYIDNQLKIDWQKYKDEIYVFNDFEILGYYLVDKRIHYHLLEDGLNFFTYFHKYYNLPAQTYKGWKVWVKNRLNILHRPYGSSQYATDIEVNDLENLEINKEKVFVVPRKQLFTKLSVEHKKQLYEIFCQCPVTHNAKAGKKTVLLCTQPLYLDGQLQSLEVQRNVYADIVREYDSKGYQITIKPHPRDAADYSALCNEFACWVLDRYFPSEILNFNPDISYDLALAVTTTAIEMLQFVKERKYLGFEFLVKYRS